MTVLYSPKDGVNALMRWRGTVLYSVTQSTIFWILQACHLGIIGMVNVNKEAMFILEWKVVQPPLSRSRSARNRRT